MVSTGAIVDVLNDKNAWVQGDECRYDADGLSVVKLIHSLKERCHQSLQNCEQSGALALQLSNPILEEGFPFCSLSILLIGCGYIINIVFAEYKVYCNTSSSVGGTITFGEYLLCRLDHYFSSSQWAKPLLLLSVTFILIVVAALIHMLVLGDSLSSAMWKTWTYVADPGKN